METVINGVTLVPGEYYRINNTKKVLCWDGEKWLKPAKDCQGRYGVWNTFLEKQPTNIKSVEVFEF